MRPLALIACGAALLGRDVEAQVSRRAPARCERIATTTFEFGRTGGNIRSTAVRVDTSGAISRLVGAVWTPSESGVPRDAVMGLARIAWSTAFTQLPSAPTKPTRNPDAARDYIDVKSACGSKHVEAVPDASAPAFRELLALLRIATR
ncbi:MAG: hypothetical protein ABI969_18490 [bacterium]